MGCWRFTWYGTSMMIIYMIQNLKIEKYKKGIYQLISNE